MDVLQKRWQKLILVSAGIVGIGLLLYILARLGYPVPCLFNKITGLSCPGCGNTRAVLALLRLDFPGMLHHNLLFPLEAGYLLWIYVTSARRYLKNGRFSLATPSPVLDCCFLAMLLIWWILRNILHI